jgi:hypothetical protein
MLDDQLTWFLELLQIDVHARERYPIPFSAKHFLVCPLRPPVRDIMHRPLGRGGGGGADRPVRLPIRGGWDAERRLVAENLKKEQADAIVTVPEASRMPDVCEDGDEGIVVAAIRDVELDMDGWALSDDSEPEELSQAKRKTRSHASASSGGGAAAVGVGAGAGAADSVGPMQLPRLGNNAEPFGPWSLSPMPFVNPTAMGANCHKHKNETDTKGNCCQTSARFTVAGSLAGARRCMKAWLLAGVDPTISRAQHMQMRKGIVERAATFTEADEVAMDAAAAALLG